MADAISTAPTATGNGADACAPSGVGSPADWNAGESSRTPEWLRPLVRSAHLQTVEFDPSSPAAAVSALATYRAAVRLALRALYAGEGDGAVRHALAEGMLLAEGYLARMDEAVELLSNYDAAMPREVLRHYIVRGTFRSGSWQLNACACGRSYEHEATARLHVLVMSRHNILSGECDCSGNRVEIPLFEGRCMGCGALLYEDGRRNREEVGA